MNCKVNFPIPNKLSTKDITPKSCYSTLKCRAGKNNQESPTNTIKFQTLEACKLGISRYPDFAYNASGGTGVATGRNKCDDNDELFVNFDVKSLYIPPLTGATTKFLGLPLPPFLKIEIVPEAFQGTVNSRTGKVELDFRARFWFSIGSLYRAPPLVVETTLTSEESKGEIREGEGERLGEDGKCRLVGVAVVHPVNDWLLDSFLGLPTECIAGLNARISISSFN